MADTELERNNQRRLAEKKQAIEDRRKRKSEMLVQIQDYLYEFNGQESNIPVNHGYWDLINQFKALNVDDDVEFVRQQETKGR